MKLMNKEIHHLQQRLKVISPIITIYDQDVVDEVEGVPNSHHNNNHQCHHYSHHHKDWCHHKQEAYNLPL
jgi:hypothetical protein